MAESDASVQKSDNLVSPAPPVPPPHPPPNPHSSHDSGTPASLLTDSLQAVQSAKDGGSRELLAHAKSLCRELVSRYSALQIML